MGVVLGGTLYPPQENKTDSRYDGWTMNTEQQGDEVPTIYISIIYPLES